VSIVSEEEEEQDEEEKEDNKEEVNTNFVLSAESRLDNLLLNAGESKPGSETEEDNSVTGTEGMAQKHSCYVEVEPFPLILPRCCAIFRRSGLVTEAQQSQMASSIQIHTVHFTTPGKTTVYLQEPGSQGGSVNTVIKLWGG
jgi:hypothetical protein